MTTMKAGIRTASGMRRFKREIITFEQMRTKVVASPMLSPLIADVVVAKVGHMPRRSTKVGFSVMIPLVIVLIYLFMVMHYLVDSLVETSTKMRCARAIPCRTAREETVEPETASMEPPSTRSLRLEGVTFFPIRELLEGSPPP